MAVRTDQLKNCLVVVPRVRLPGIESGSGGWFPSALAILGTSIRTELEAEPTDAGTQGHEGRTCADPGYHRSASKPRASQIG